jgi:uncharacterized YigZ family protein
MKQSKRSAIFTYEVKQSKFIAHFIPFSDFHRTLQELKTKHPKARHFVTASRYLNAFDQIVEHSNDDGEPKGTSGKPSLMVLQGEDIINAGVIVVRYFGGTKLGTGGLVRAYSEAVHGVLKELTFEEYEKRESVLVALLYEDLRLLEYECQHLGVEIVEKSFDTGVVCRLQAEQKSLTLLFEKLQRVLTTL